MSSLRTTRELHTAGRVVERNDCPCSASTTLDNLPGSALEDHRHPIPYTLYMADSLLPTSLGSCCSDRFCFDVMLYVILIYFIQVLFWLSLIRLDVSSLLSRQTIGPVRSRHSSLGWNKILVTGHRHSYRTIWISRLSSV